MTNSVAVSIVTFNGRHLIQKCLESVISQTWRISEIHVVDNGSTDGTPDFVSAHFPAVHLVSLTGNIGFGAGHNMVIRQTKTDFVLVLNQDAFLDRQFVEELVCAITSYPEVGIAGGKLYSLRNDGASTNRYVNLIDMTWLDIEKKRRQVCYAHSKPDNSQSGNPRLVFAIDGAAMLLRKRSLEDLRFEEEFFDEDFFAGKEDLDICWRAQLCGWRCLHVPSAIGWHVRTFAPVDRRSLISESLKVNSVRNRYLLMAKNDFLRHLLRHFAYIFAYELEILAFILLFERPSMRGYLGALKLLPRALVKRRALMQCRRVHPNYILHWFR